MFFFDPLYLAIIVVGALLSGGAALLTKGTFARFSKVGTRRQLSGAEVARLILRDEGIRDVSVEAIPGSLTDHYDPRTKTLRLSEPVFGGRSIAAIGVAAHEVGHAIQHAHGYAWLQFRSAWVPVASTATNISIFVLIAAAMLGGAHTAIGATASWIGVALFGTATVFTLVTLPVEFDASHRALAILSRGGYTTHEELQGARKVLNAAALTYVAAFVASLMTLLYWAYRLGLFGQRRD